MKREKEITLAKVGYHCEGTATLNLWGGGVGKIEMKPFKVKHLREIKEGINDNGFGCRDIVSASVDIFNDYGECKRFIETMTIKI
jgi:hypothetical protein